MASSTLKADFRIHGLDCAEEVKLIRRQLDNTHGLHDLGFDVVRGRMSAEFDPQILTSDQIVASIAKTGLKAEPWHEGELTLTFWQEWGRWIAAAASGLALAVVMLLDNAASTGPTGFFDGQHTHSSSPALVAFALLAISVGMIYTAPKAWGALRLVQPDMNVLVAISIVGACYLGEWSEGATLAFLFSIAGVLEVWSLSRARKEIGQLMQESPSEANVLHGKGADFHAHCCHKDKEHMHEHRVTVDTVPPGSVVRVRPGEQIPFDGHVKSGASGVNEAMLTGESTPVLKQTGDSVLAGSINTDGLLEIRTTTPAGDTTLARIIRMVEDSETRRAPSEQFVERFSRIYTPAMMSLALLVAVWPPLFMSWTWSHAFYQSMVVLLIACPCALVISTPVTIAAAIASAAKRGVLFKGGAHLETAAHLEAIALDKTGVITSGRPEVAEVQLRAGRSERDFLERVAGLETGSEHPLAKAIVRYAESHDIRAADTVDFKALPGRGAEALVHGEPFWIGSSRFAADRGVDVSDSEQPGFTHIHAGSGHELWGSILLRDQLRPGIREVVRELRKLGVREITMLTGDGEAAASKVAKEIDTPSYRSSMMPADKAEAVRQLRRRFSSVAMMGDGINDAEAMACASLGIAFGPLSSGLAIETADAVVLSEDPARLPFLVRHAKRTLAVIKQNLALALGSKVVFLAVAMFGAASLWMAVAADMGATLVVIFNGLRMLRAKE